MGIELGSQVTICDYPVRIDTYEGCTHDCRYCFARRDRNIGIISPDSCIQQLKNFIDGQRQKNMAWVDWNIPLHWGGMSDPFQPLEKKYRISKQALEIFAETGYPFIVSTKGRLIADDEYLSLLDKCNAVVQISMVCSKYDKLEPGTPTYEERLEICRKVAPHVKRLIVRLQPYFTDVLRDVCDNIPRLAEAGVYGITIEGMKFVKSQANLIKVGADYVYPKHILEAHFTKIKETAHKNGMKFYCAENRLRSMGDSMTCCGCDDIPGFTPNRFNCEHIYNGDITAPTDAMQHIGTGTAFKGVYQSAGTNSLLNTKTFEEVMVSRDIFDTCSSVIIGDGDQVCSADEAIQFAHWLRSLGVTSKDIGELTGTEMGSHYLCTKKDGQWAIPTPDQFEKILRSPKIKIVPDFVRNLVYGRYNTANKNYSDIIKAYKHSTGGEEQPPSN